MTKRYNKREKKTMIRRERRKRKNNTIIFKTWREEDLFINHYNVIITLNPYKVKFSMIYSISLLRKFLTQMDMKQGWYSDFDWNFGWRCMKCERGPAWYNGGVGEYPKGSKMCYNCYSSTCKICYITCDQSPNGYCWRCVPDDSLEKRLFCTSCNIEFWNTNFTYKIFPPLSLEEYHERCSGDVIDAKDIMFSNGIKRAK